MVAPKFQTLKNIPRVYSMSRRHLKRVNCPSQVANADSKVIDNAMKMTTRFISGVSRGAHVGRFLAEMLDHVGLLSAGNEGTIEFTWKAFTRWQQREENTADKRKEKKELLDSLLAFRETFQ